MSEAIIRWIGGPVLHARTRDDFRVGEAIEVGFDRRPGEVIRLQGDELVGQVYEDTTGLRPGDAVRGTGSPLSIRLGPRLLGRIFDGLLRPLEEGAEADAAIPFQALVRIGDRLAPGSPIGELPSDGVRQQCLLPPRIGGTVERIVSDGLHSPDAILCTIRDTAGAIHDIGFFHHWPIRQARPVRERLPADEPMITGQRILDTLFPVARGGQAAIPGGFGTGKTITQHQLAKWSDAEIIVFIGCGERGNEMTEVLREFPELKDPRTGRPLMERTILIANTSNMPVAAREVSIYTGITLAEYYRDMGKSVAVFADSTSRWAEALRELAARLEEMPAEEGFPATLPTRLAQFYERGGAVTTLAGERGSVSIVGAVSPPGGDFSEPVTQHTRRFIRCFWALDTELANARHYPSIHWLHSYSEYVEDVGAWWEKQSPDWSEIRIEALTLLQREDRLQQIVKLVGPDALPDSQRLILFIAEILKDGFLAQSAFDENDMYCAPERQVALLRIILTLYRRGRDLIQAGAPLGRLRGLACVPQVMRAKSAIGTPEKLAELQKSVGEELDLLSKEFSKKEPT